MKVFIILSLVSLALASLEPAGYRPPGSNSPSSGYLPPSQYSTPSNQYLPATRYGAPSSVEVPSNQYLPASQYSAGSSLVAPSNQYLPANKYSGSLQHASQTPSNQYLPANQYSGSSTSLEVPSSHYLPVAREQAAPQWTISNVGSVAQSQNRYNSPSREYLPAAQYTGLRSQPAARPSNLYLPAVSAARYASPSHSLSAHSSSSSSSSYSAPSNQYLPANSYAGGNSGYRYAAAEESAPAKYDFEYEVKDEPSANEFGHKESRDGDNTQGVYSVVLPDGRKQIVHYEADQDGFKPRISYEEPKQGYYNRQSGYGQGYPQGPY